MPGGNENPGTCELLELREVAPDVVSGPLQDGRVLALAVEDRPGAPVIHIRPEGSHHPAVTGDGEGNWSELRHLPEK